MESYIQRFLSDINKVISKNPKNDEAWFIKAFIYMAMEQFAEADSFLDTAISINPKNDLAYILKVFLHGSKGRFPEAEKYLDRAIELNPSLNELIHEVMAGAVDRYSWETSIER